MVSLTKEEITQLKILRNKILAEESFYEFFKQAWYYIEGPKKPYVDNWHIEAICDHLQAAHKKEIRNLILNLPPRAAKSTIMAVAFPAWCWIHAPHEKFLYASHSISLATRDSIRCRNLIMSPWYQENWGHYVKIQKSTEDRFDNSHKGYRMVTSPTSRVTGEGGDYLIGDDLNDMTEVQSDVKRPAVNEWFSTTFSSRINNPKTGVMILQQQRGHQRDVTGFVLAHDFNKEFVVLSIPMEFEEARRCVTVALHNTDGKPWTDPRTVDNELMFGEWFTKEHVNAIKARLGTAAYAGQYQQRPAPVEGSIIKRDWFKWWKEPEVPNIEYVIQSWDTAFSEKKEAAYSACTTWGVFYDEHGLGNVIFLSMWRGRVGYPDLRERAKRLYFDYRDKGEERNSNLRGQKIDCVLIESKATGDPLIRDLQKAGIYATPYNPTRQGDKMERVHKITALINAGVVWLPTRSPSYEALTIDASEFLEDILYFPNGESRDLVDTMTQVLRYLSDMDILNHPKDEREPASYRNTPVIY